MSLIIAFSILFGVPLLCMRFGPAVGNGGREVLAFMWLFFALFPCVIAGASISKWIYGVLQ